ncbi:tail protein [Klebsiella sp. RIT-PI-d]|uniref:phage tail tape measure protein n=1 Tax=Klebsiella sp. RIT-PI-d TaxID=1681196 RepID=UPI0006765C00|nr:phage tail tape measure protein [Klebsiella sp. RIT-PI-d]KNC09993.1 tail protein [Klebsiella sp. RIT-PI-d]
MAQQISDLVINLDLDSATFTEQVARIKNQFSGLANETDKVQSRMQQAAAAQAAALSRAAAGNSAAISEMQSSQTSATAGLSTNMQAVSRSVDDAHQRIAALTQQLRENESRSSQLAHQQDALAASFYREIDSVSKLTGETSSLSSIQERIRRERDKGNITQQDYLALLSQTTARQKDLQRAEETAERTRARFIEQLKSQVDAQTLSHTELLNMKAAQLGVSQQAAPLIAKLREQDEAWKKGGISAGQYRQALRMLPAQFTDIATSIAGGMPLWMVLIQQGGQISDSFGGIGGLLRFIKEELLGFKEATDDSSESLSENANSLAENVEHGQGLLRFLTPTRAAMGGLVGVASLLATAWYKGTKEAEEFNKQLILTGSYAGKTAGQLGQLSRQIADDAGVTIGEASATLAKIVGTGKFDGSKLEVVARTAAAMEDAVGQSVETTIANFRKLYDSPAKASEELNSQLHYLSSAQYEYISSLEKRGYKEAAGEAAATAYGQAEQQRSQQVLDNLGLIDRVVRGVSDTWKAYWDAALGIGRKQTSADQLESVRKRIKEITDQSRPGIFGMGNIGDGGAANKELLALRQQEKELEFVVKSQEGYSEAQARAKKADEDRTESLIYQNQILSKNISWQQQRSAALTVLWSKVAKAPELWSEEERTRAVAQINKDFHPSKNPKAKGYTVPAGERLEDAGQTELLSLQAQLKTLQEHRSVNDTISQQRKDLYTTESKFAVLEAAARTRQLSKQEQSLLASKDQVLELARQKALLGDQITAQEQLNKRMDTASKYATQMAEKQAALKSGVVMSDRLASRETALSQLRSGWLNAGGSLDDVGFRQQLTAANDYYAAEDKLRSDWQAGAKKGWAEYQDSALNVFSSVQQISQSTFSGLANQLTMLTTTGKASFKEFTTSILKMIASVTNQLLVAYTLQSAMGWISGNAQMPATGQSLAVPSFRPPGYDGGGFTGHGGKYDPAGIVHRGEFVFHKKATSRLGVGNLYRLMRGYATGGLVGGSGSPAGASPFGVNVYAPVSVTTQQDNAQPKGNNDQLGRAYQQVIDKAVRDGIARESRPGGILWGGSKQR